MLLHKTSPLSLHRTQGEYKAQLVTISNTGNAHVVNAKIGINIAEYIGEDAVSQTIDWTYW
jgi:hypothetical protein